MSRNYDIIENKTDWPDNAFRALLDLAWDVVNRDIKLSQHAPVYKVTIAFNSNSPYCGRFNGHKSFKLSFNDPSLRKSYCGSFSDTQYATFNEVFVGLAAWMFAATACDDRRLLKSVSRDGIVAAAETAATLEHRIAEAKQAVITRENMKLARQVLKNMETGTVEYKLKRLEKQEKTWHRKLKLATTKLAGLRRRRSAIIAASKRQQKCLQDQSCSSNLCKRIV